MKKFLSFIIVAVMLFSAMIISSSAEVSDYGTLAFEENFDDPSKIEGWKNAMLGNTDIKTNADAAFKIENGKLIFSDFTNSTTLGPRFTLYQVPEDVTEFTVVMEFSTTINKGGDTLGLIIADNGIDNWDAATGATKQNNQGLFQLFWLRAGTSTGIQSYGPSDFINAGRENMTTKYEANGETHVLTITVDLTINMGVATLQKKTDSGLEIVDGVENKFFTYQAENIGKQGDGVKPKIGLLNISANASVEYVKVYTKTELDTTAPETTVATPDTTTSPDETTAPTTTAPSVDTTAPDTTPTNNNTENNGSNTGLIIGIIAAILVVSVIVSVIIIKKKKA